MSSYTLKNADIIAINNYLNSHYERVNAGTPIRKAESYGYAQLDRVWIEFEPHHQHEGFELFYTLQCDSDVNNVLTCGDLIEKRSLTIAEFDDVVEVEDTISADIATSLIGFIHDEIVVDGAGHYRFNYGDEERISSHSLDLRKISQTKANQFLILAHFDERCSGHEIIVQQKGCIDSGCSFELIENQIVWYP